MIDNLVGDKNRNQIVFVEKLVQTGRLTSRGVVEFQQKIDKAAELDCDCDD